MKTGFNAITAVMLFFLLVSATAAGNGFIVPLFDSQKISGLTVQKQPEIKAELKPNIETLNITVQEFNAIIQETSIKKSFSVQGKQAVSKDSTECSALSENQKIPAPTQALLDISCQGQASIGGCSGLNCSGIQSLLCSYCSSVNPSINHLSSCTPSSCPSGYFDQGVVCQPSGACNNCDGSNCDYDCAHQSLSCTRTCTTNPCTNPDYPNYCDGYCWSNCSSVGLYGGKCCNGSWRCCNSSSYPQLCCPDSGNPIMCTTQNDSCLSNGCSVNYPYKCNNKCWSCPTGTNLCCPSSGDPSHCCGTGQVCQSSGTCYTPPTNARIYGYLKDHYGNPLPGRTMRLTDCSDNTQYSDTTESNGYWEIIAPANSFKLKTDVWWGTIVWNVSGQECYSYSAQDYFLGDLQVNTETVNYGYLKNEYGNGWNNILVELTSCSDNVIISDRTNLDGYFNLRALKGNYKLKTHMPWGVIEWTVNEVECPLYYWNEWNIGTLPINANAIVSGQIVGHQNNGLQGVEAKLTQCFGSNSYSDFTDLQGNFSVSAPKNYYKFQTVFGWGTIKWIIDNNECNLFTGNNISLGTLPKIDSTIHGYFHDLDNNPISGLRVELFDCTDNFVAYATTSSTGFFSIYNDAGKYQLKVVIQGYRIPLTDFQGNSCFVFFGDLDLGTLNINPSINCSGFNNTCYNNNWRLFSCYFDSTVPSCVCYYEVCEFGCTKGQNYCNAGQQKLIKIDVDSINNNFNALPGARIYLDNEFKGTTDSFGKKDVYAFPGFRTIKVLCPDSSFCAEKGIYLNSTAWEYFDCSCTVPQQTGDIIVDLSVISGAVINGFEINGRPIAFADVYLDDRFIDSTDLAGQVFLDDVSFGNHELEFLLCVEEIEGNDCQTKHGSININVSQELEVMKFGIYDYELFNNSGLNVSSFNIGDRTDVVILDYNGEFTGKVAPLVVALVVIGVAFVAWDAYDVHACSQQYGLPNDIMRWQCWDEVAWLGVNFIPVGGIIAKGGKIAVFIGNKAKYLPEIGEIIEKVISKVGKNTWKVGSKYAGETIEYTVKYADDGARTIKITKNVATILLKNADETANAVKIIRNEGDNFIKIGDTIITKGDIPGNAGNIQGKLGEIMSDEYIKKISQNADEGIEIIVKSGTPGTTIQKGGYTFKFLEDGKNIEFKKLDGSIQGELDRLLIINEKPVVIESKASKLTTFESKITADAIKNKLDAAKAFSGENEAEIILQVPNGQFNNKVVNVVKSFNGKVIQFSTTVEEFVYSARMLGAN
ncbi:MAG: carboxypeptidase-like regulatory domain-containing protein [archaeon]